MKWLALLILAFPAAADELTLPMGSTLSVEVAPSRYAVLTLTGEQLTLSGPEGPELHFERIEYYSERSDFIGYAKDITGDGWTDLMIFTDWGYGGVNNFHDVLVFVPGTGWHKSGSVSNPSFFDDAPGFETQYRSGPGWGEAHWKIGLDGLAYRAVEQVHDFSGFARRRDFSPNGELQRTILVAEDQPVSKAAKSATTIVGSVGAELMPDGMLVVPPGTPVTAIEMDDATGWVMIEVADGQRGWVDPERLVPPSYSE